MRYDLKRPCPHCPFRTDIPGYLRPARCTEIAEALAGGGEFPCHQTTVSVDDEDGSGDTAAGPESQFCAGALLLLEQQDRPNQIMRVAERTGLYDAAKLDRSAPIARDFHEFRAHHAGEDSAECCAIVGGGCEAPAGMLVDGIVVPVEATGDLHECPVCGQPVCDACSSDEGVCRYCAEDAA